MLAFCDYFTARSSGGAERVTMEVLTRLSDSGFEVRVVTAIPRGMEDGSGPVPTERLDAMDLTRLLGVQYSHAVGFAATGRRAIEDFRPDVLHAAGIHFQGSRVAARLAPRYAVPLVTTVHVGETVALKGLRRLAAKWYDRSIGRRILRRSHHVIAVSESAADHARALGSRAVTVVPNGVDSERFSPAPDRASAPIEIVFVGRLVANKGPRLALEAFASLPPGTARLSFVGDGPLRSSLERRVRALAIEEHVRFTGFREDVATILAGSHVLVRPSTTEGRSLAMLEAQAAEVLVIASDIPPNRELIVDRQTGLLHRVDDVGDLASALNIVVADAALRREIAAAGRASVAGSTWEVTAAATGRILAEAAAR